MNTWLSTIGAAIVAGVVFFFLGRETAPRPAPVTVRDSLIVPVIVTDTLVRIEYRSLPARIETVTVAGGEEHVTASVEQVVASGEYRDTVAVVYHFPPHNLFDVTLGLQPRQRETRTVYIREPAPPVPGRSWLDRIAVGPGMSMVYSAGKLHFGPSMSVSFDVLP